MDQKLVKAVLSFCEGKPDIEKLELRPLIPAFALLRYMRRSIVEIHEFAKLQGYQGGYNAFAKWLQRNVNFEAEFTKYADEFEAITTGTKPVPKANEETSGAAGDSIPSATDVFAPRTPEPPVSSATVVHQEQSSVSKPPKEAEKKPSPRDILNKWQTPSYEDQLEKLGLHKGKHDDKNSSR